jgi:hypothetical protein
MRFALILTGVFCLGLGLPAHASAPASSREAATAQTKQPARKVADVRERRRPPPTSVGRGCIGCFQPLDGTGSTMAVRIPGE